MSVAALILQARQPNPPIVTTPRGPTGEIMHALTRQPPTPIVAVLGPPGPASSDGVIDGGVI